MAEQKAEWKRLIETMPSCECRVFGYGMSDGDEISIDGLSLEYCPLHARAQEMRNALRGLLDALDHTLFSGGPHIGKTHLSEQREIAQTLLLKIDGETE